MSQNNAPWRYETNGTLAIVQFDDQAVLVWRNKQEASFFLVEAQRSTLEIIGRRARRGPDWVWGNQGGVDMLGTIVGVSSVEEGWVRVLWDNGQEFFYRWGVDGCFDLALIAKTDQPLTLWQRFRHALRAAWNGGHHV